MTQKIRIDDTIYEANLDFRVAIECNRIAEDETIGDYERVLGIICTLFGKDGINNPNHYQKLLEWALNYLTFGVKVDKKDEEPDMDLIEDKKYIKSSFKYDYQYDPYEKDFLSWEDFFNDLNNLSNNEFNCCILSRIRNLRNYDTSKIKDQKERKKIEEAKERVALKKKHKQKSYTDEELNNMEEFYKQMERR